MSRLLILLTLPTQVTTNTGLGSPHDSRSSASTGGSSLQDRAVHGQRRRALTFGPMMKDEVLHGADKLRWVQALGTGVDNLIDLPSLRPEVVVTNIRGIHGAPVSEAALMMMLAVARHFAGSVRNQDRHVWTRWPAQLLEGKTVGIFGVGLIAEVLAPKCKALGMNVVGFTSAQRQLAGFDRMHDRGALIAKAGTLDFLVLLAPYSEEIRNLVCRGPSPP